MKLLQYSVLLLCCLGFTGTAFAQESPSSEPAAEVAENGEAAAEPAIDHDANVRKLPVRSLTFLPSIYPRIVAVKLEFLKNVNKTKEQVQEEIEAEVEATKPTGARDIYLDGIIYRKEGDWIVWLNGQKLTPQNLPPQVKDIRVTKEAVELKWYDDFSQLIYPIRIRPNQAFNLDSRFYYSSSSAKRSKADGAGDTSTR